MTIIYKTDDGKEFESRELAEKWEKIRKEKVEWTTSVNHNHNLIPPSELKNIFSIGDIFDLRLYLRDLRTGRIYEDGGYEIYLLDKSGHLDLSDLSHGLLYWSKIENCYFRRVHELKWPVELIGIEKVIYC